MRDSPDGKGTPTTKAGVPSLISAGSLESANSCKLGMRRLSDTSVSTDFIKYSDDIPKLRRDRSITMP